MDHHSRVGPRRKTKLGWWFRSGRVSANSKIGKVQAILNFGPFLLTPYDQDNTDSDSDDEDEANQGPDLKQLQAKLVDLQTCHDLIKKHQSSLQRVINDLGKSLKDNSAYEPWFR